MTGRIAGAVAALALTIPWGAAAQTKLEAMPLFDGSIASRATSGAAQPVHVVVQNWTIPNDGAAHEIPLTGFYVAHLQSGDIAATIAGDTVDHRPGDFWSVKSGATMSVTVQSELAVVETIAPSKQ